MTLSGAALRAASSFGIKRKRCGYTRSDALKIPSHVTHFGVFFSSSRDLLIAVIVISVVFVNWCCGFDLLGRFFISSSLEFLADLRLLGNLFGGFDLRHQL